MKKKKAINTLQKCTIGVKRHFTPHTREKNIITKKQARKIIFEHKLFSLV